MTIHTNTIAAFLIGGVAITALGLLLACICFLANRRIAYLVTSSVLWLTFDRSYHKHNQAEQDGGGNSAALRASP